MAQLCARHDVAVISDVVLVSGIQRGAVDVVARYDSLGNLLEA
jgi:bifunctional pyridoxal-dependent enzyme with beta-cystathionase and maltose regulon repressor activities